MPIDARLRRLERRVGIGQPVVTDDECDGGEDCCRPGNGLVSRSSRPGSVAAGWPPGWAASRPPRSSTRRPRQMRPGLRPWSRPTPSAARRWGCRRRRSAWGWKRDGGSTCSWRSCVPGLRRRPDAGEHVGQPRHPGLGLHAPDPLAYTLGGSGTASARSRPRAMQYRARHGSGGLTGRHGTARERLG